jgi:hypothetical protein
LKADKISLCRPVSRRVNRTGNGDDPKLIAEVTLEQIPADVGHRLYPAWRK